MSILLDKRLKSVQWKDLTKLSPIDIFIENNISVPWILVSWALAYYGYYIIALPFSFLFFLTGLRQSHNGFHYALGLSKKATGIVLFINSVLMMAAMHAVKYNHLRHHKYCLQEGDVEGNCAKMKAWQALLYGPMFIFKQHASALKSGKRSIVNNVLLELLAMGMFASLVFYLDIAFLEYHVIAMAIGEFFTAFFAVWTVHHDCDEHVFARSVSTKWKNIFTYNMFYHLEHHLFPKVPTIKLPELARRIREEMPDLKAKEVF